MKLSRNKLAQVIAVLADRGSARSVAKQTAAYLLSEGRVGELDSLLRDISQFRADHVGIIEIDAFAAHDLSPGLRAEITHSMRRHYPAAKRIQLIEHIDPAVLGGVRLEMANEQLDLSIRRKLNEFKQLTSAGV